MGSFNSTCHLSSMAISENEPVLLLPISYGYVSDTSTLIYGTNQSCHPLWVPFIGKYNGYGSVEDVTNEGDILRLRKTINNRLFNNDKYAERQKEGKYLGSFYTVFKNDGSSDFKRLEFLDDQSIWHNIHNRINVPSIQSIDDNEELLNLITRNHLSGFNCHVNRIGYNLIKKSFFDAMVANHYSKTKTLIENNIYNLVRNSHKGDELINDKFRHSPEFNINYFSSKVLCLFNDDDSISHDLFQIIMLFRLVQQTTEENLDQENFDAQLKTIVDSIVNLALILHIYADIGKSFYPNVKPRKNMKCLNDFAETLSKAISSTREKNIEDFKINNGDDEEIPASEQWQAPYFD